MRAVAPASSPERVDDYIASLPDGRRAIVERVHEVITDAVPELEVRMLAVELVRQGRFAM
jgi:hypothetical protein